MVRRVSSEKIASLTYIELNRADLEFLFLKQWSYTGQIFHKTIKDICQKLFTSNFIRASFPTTRIYLQYRAGEASSISRRKPRVKCVKCALVNFSHGHTQPPSEARLDLLHTPTLGTYFRPGVSDVPGGRNVKGRKRDPSLFVGKETSR